MLNRASRYLLAAIQVILGWEWLTFLLIIIIANLAMIKELRGGYLFSRWQATVVQEEQEEVAQEQA